MQVNSGVAGNTDGVGLSATFTSPFGLDAKDGFLYVTQGTGGNNIRRISLATLDVIDLKGNFGVAGNTNFEEY